MVNNKKGISRILQKAEAWLLIRIRCWFSIPDQILLRKKNSDSDPTFFLQFYHQKLYRIEILQIQIFYLVGQIWIRFLFLVRIGFGSSHYQPGSATLISMVVYFIEENKVFICKNSCNLHYIFSWYNTFVLYRINRFFRILVEFLTNIFALLRTLIYMKKSLLFFVFIVLFFCIIISFCDYWRRKITKHLL